MGTNANLYSSFMLRRFGSVNGGEFVIESLAGFGYCLIIMLSYYSAVNLV